MIAMVVDNCERSPPKGHSSEFRCDDSVHMQGHCYALFSSQGKTTEDVVRRQSVDEAA